MAQFNQSKLHFSCGITVYTNLHISTFRPQIRIQIVQQILAINNVLFLH